MKHRPIWNVLFLGGAVAALMLLASGLSGLALSPGRSYTQGGGRGGAGLAGGAPILGAQASPLVYVLLIVAFLAVLGYLLVSIGVELARSRRRHGLIRQALAALLAIMALAYLISRWARLQAGAESLPVDTPAPPPGVPFPVFSAQPPWWLAIVLSAALAALLSVGISYFWRRGRQPEQPLLAVAQAALADLQAGGDLRDTVLRCYRDMSQVLREQRAVERDSAMTPREFADYLSAQGMSDEHIQRLTRLFERVRYGGQVADERDSREAVACLTAIVAAYSLIIQDN